MRWALLVVEAQPPTGSARQMMPRTRVENFRVAVSIEKDLFTRPRPHVIEDCARRLRCRCCSFNPHKSGIRADQRLLSRNVSKRNQMRCSPSSIQFSIKLAVAMSPCSSQTSCKLLRVATSAALSSLSSASIS